MPTEPDRFLRKKTAGDAAREPEERQEKPRRSLAKGGRKKAAGEGRQRQVTKQGDL
jgi:hypothetical protein